MQVERRRSPRYSFVTMAEVVDEEENARTSTRISDLSLQGCYVEMLNPFPQGKKVMIEIYTESEFVEAPVTVAYQQPKKGMGLQFTGLTPHSTGVLNKWVKQAHDRKAN